MFKVLENGKDAVLPKSREFCNNKFANLESAFSYVKEWLGQFFWSLPSDWDGSEADYNGYGDTIAIVETDEKMWEWDPSKGFDENKKACAKFYPGFHNSSFLNIIVETAENHFRFGRGYDEKNIF